MEGRIAKVVSVVRAEETVKSDGPMVDKFSNP